MSNFLSEGSGLFGTHVSLTDVNLAISEQMSTNAQLTEHTEFHAIGDGNGYSSRVLLVKPHWTHPETLPDTFVLKIISSEHMNALVNASSSKLTELEKSRRAAHFESTAKKLHNQEVKFYRILENLGGGVGAKLMAPKVLFSRIFDERNTSKGFLAMEHVCGATVKHVHQNVHPDALEPILRALAVLQALRLSPEEQRSIGTSIFEETMRPMLEHGMGGLFEFVRKMDNGRLAQKVEEIESFGTELMDLEKAFHLNQSVGIEHNVLCHGDLWGTNVLWNSENIPERIIDFQIVHYGNPVEDLVRLFVSMLSGADRRAHYEELLEKFYDFYKEELAEHKPVYSLEQLKNSYNQYFVVGALSLLPMFGPVAHGAIKSSEHQKIVSDNLECLLEDVCFFHNQ